MRNYLTSLQTRWVGIREFLRRRNWEALIAATALFISIYQTYDNSQDSKVKNKRDSTQIAILTETYKQGIEENNRIRHRDAIQIDVLLKTYEQVINENRRLKDRDIKQTNILAESNLLSKDYNETIKRNNSSFFQIGYTIDNSKPYQINPANIRFKPSIVLKNVGQVPAHHIVVSYFVVTIDNYMNNKMTVSNLINHTYLEEVNVGKTVQLDNITPVDIAYKNRLNRDSLTRLNPAIKNTSSRYTYVIVLRVKSVNENLNKAVDKFSVRAYTPNATHLVSIPSSVYNPLNNREWAYSFNPAYETISFSYIETFAKKYDFDFKELKNQLGQEYSYQKSYFY